MEFAQRLHDLMESRGLTNYRLAKDLDVHPTTIANWIDGKLPRKKTIATLCDYFSVSENYLMGKEEKPAEDIDELIKDEPMAAYDNLKEHLTQSDEEDIAQLIRIRAELNQNKKG